MLDSLHYENFAHHLNSKFQMRAGEEAQEIELIEVTDKAPSPKREPFAL